MNIFKTKPKFCFLIKLSILLHSRPTLSTVKGEITYLLGLEYVLCRHDWSVEGDGIFFFQVYEITLQWLGGFTGFYTGKIPSYMIAAHINSLTTTMDFFHLPIFWKPSIQWRMDSYNMSKCLSCFDLLNLEACFPFSHWFQRKGYYQQWCQ